MLGRCSHSLTAESTARGSDETYAHRTNTVLRENRQRLPIRNYAYPLYGSFVSAVGACPHRFERTRNELKPFFAIFGLDLERGPSSSSGLMTAIKSWNAIVGEILLGTSCSLRTALHNAYQTDPFSLSPVPVRRHKE